MGLEKQHLKSRIKGHFPLSSPHETVQKRNNPLISLIHEPSRLAPLPSQPPFLALSSKAWYSCPLPETQRAEALLRKTLKYATKPDWQHLKSHLKGHYTVF